MTPRAFRYDLRLLTRISTQALTGRRLSGNLHKHDYIAQKPVQIGCTLFSAYREYNSWDFLQCYVETPSRAQKTTN